MDENKHDLLNSLCRVLAKDLIQKVIHILLSFLILLVLVYI